MVMFYYYQFLKLGINKIIMKTNKIFIVIMVFVYCSCSSEKEKSEPDKIIAEKGKGNDRIKINNIKLDTIIKNYFNLANEYGKKSNEAYKMIIESNKNETEIILSSFKSIADIKNLEPTGWYESKQQDTLLIYSPLDKIGIYDSCHSDVQKILSKKLISDSTMVLMYDAFLWKIVIKEDSTILYKFPSQWAKPRKKEIIHFGPPQK